MYCYCLQTSRMVLCGRLGLRMCSMVFNITGISTSPLFTCTITTCSQQSLDNNQNKGNGGHRSPRSLFFFVYADTGRAEAKIARSLDGCQAQLNALKTLFFLKQNRIITYLLLFWFVLRAPLSSSLHVERLELYVEVGSETYYLVLLHEHEITIAGINFIRY